MKKNTPIEDIISDFFNMLIQFLEGLFSDGELSLAIGASIIVFLLIFAGGIQQWIKGPEFKTFETGFELSFKYPRKMVVTMQDSSTLEKGSVYGELNISNQYQGVSISWETSENLTIKQLEKVMHDEILAWIKKEIDRNIVVVNEFKRVKTKEGYLIAVSYAEYVVLDHPVPYVYNALWFHNGRQFQIILNSNMEEAV